jgi:Protein of unknown function (DUF2283)
MNKSRKYHLNVEAYDYDLQNDSILFYKEGEKYKSSVEFNGIILDFSENDNIMTLEMLDVSDKFHVSKSELLNIKHFDATIEITKQNIKVTMNMEIIKRNTVLAKCLEALTINNMNIPSSTQEIAITC